MSSSSVARAGRPLKRVLLVGATGLVGQHLLRQLLLDPEVGEVRALVRRPLTRTELLGESWPVEAADKLQLHEVDFERLTEYATVFEVDWVCCALGTTRRQAGTRAAFRRVDFDYPLTVAELARALGASQFLLVSAVGAHARSVFFYNRLKGELEEAIRDLAFPSVTVARPSLLAGARAEFRLGERLALYLGPLLPSAYKPVDAARVAAGLLQSAREERPGWHVLTNVVLRRMR